MTRVYRFFNVRPDEARPALVLFGYYFMIGLINTAGRSATRSIFLVNIPAADTLLPLALVAVAIGSGFFALLYTRTARRLQLIPLVIGTSLLFALVMGILTFFSQATWAVIGLYIWLEIASTMAGVQFFLLGGAIFDTRQAKRIYGLTGAGGAIAGLLTGLAIQPLTALLGSSGLLWVTVIAFVVIAMIAWQARGLLREDEDESSLQGEEAGAGLRIDRTLLPIAAAVAIMILVATTVDYQFNIVMRDTIPDQDTLTVFFGRFYAAVSVLQLLMRLLVVSRVLERFGILAGLLMLPAAMAVGSVALIVQPGAGAAILLKSLDQIIRWTITETAMELLWVPIPAALRLRSKPFISGTLVSLFQGISGALIFGVRSAGFEVVILSFVLLGFIAVWTPILIRLRKGYIDSLTESLLRRDLGLGELSIDVTDQAIVVAIDDKLMHGNEAEQAFLLTMLEGSRLDPWAEALRYQFENGSYLIRRQVMQMAANYPQVLPNPSLLWTIEEGSEVAADAIRIAAARKVEGLLPMLENRMNHADLETRTAVYEAVLTLDHGPVAQAEEALRDLLDGTDEREILAALDAVARMPLEAAREVLDEDRLIRLLGDSAVSVRRVALGLMHRGVIPVDPAYAVPVVAYSLADRALEADARAALSGMPARAVIRELLALMADPSTALDLRVSAARALEDFPNPEVSIALGNRLRESTLPSMTTAILDTLLAHARQGSLPPALKRELEDQRWEILVSAYRLAQYLKLVGEKEEDLLLRVVIQEDLKTALPLILKLTLMDRPDTDVDAILGQIFDVEGRSHGNALEILDNVCTMEEREQLLPLLDGRSIAEVVAVGPRFVGALPGSLSTVIRNWISSDDDWRAVVALDYAMRHRRFDVLLEIDMNALPAHHPHADRLRRFLADIASALSELSATGVISLYKPTAEGEMYSTLEKTIFLKQSDLFGQVPPKQLYYLAQTVEEHALSAGAHLFDQGEPGGTMYLIVKGAMRIHVKGRELAVLKPGQSIGELSIVDGSPRSAAATAIEATTLLSLTDRDFSRVVSTNPDIMKAVVIVISDRLRAANARLMQSRDRSTRLDSLLEKIEEEHRD